MINWKLRVPSVVFTLITLNISIRRAIIINVEYQFPEMLLISQNGFTAGVLSSDMKSKQI